MSEETATKLMILVERVVRPLRASTSRKRQIREELLAHVTAIFEEEVEKSGDEAVSLERTSQRLGAPREISGELQGSLSAWNRIDAFFQGARLKPGESLAHLARRTAVAFVVVYLGLTTCMLLPTAATGKSLSFSSMRSSPVVAAFPVIPAFLLTLVAPLHSRTLFGTRSERNLRLVIVCLAASLALLPVAAYLTYCVLTQIGAPDRDIKEFANVCWFSFIVAPMFPLCLVAGARTYADDFRDEQKWARLEIEG